VTGARFWPSWSIWAVTMVITATAIGYDALHLTGIVSRALEPAHVSVWISRPQGGS
jgi:hypothetical protein